MNDFYNIYSNDIPEFIHEFSSTRAVQRLKFIGMNCGCEYTDFKTFRGVKYSRYTHSIGVALIIWTFTHDIRQSVAGLLHDISTPVFAHTIDFLNGDHDKQESTELDTKKFIEDSKEILDLLEKYHLSVEDVCDYHKYPIADNESPKLSADRLEYSLGNMVHYGFVTREKATEFFDDIVVSKNELLETELVFKTEKLCAEFTKNVLKNSRVYVSDEDRFAMQYLADIIQIALEEELFDKQFLYTTEYYVIDRLKKCKKTNELWSRFTRLHEVIRSENGRRIHAKKRYIDPIILNKGRISSISDELNSEIHSFIDKDFNYYIIGR